MDRIYDIIKNSRAIKKTKRRVDFILKRKLKFYTKEFFKFLNFTLIALAFILAMVLIKYKPIYEVKLSGEEVGYVKNKSDFQQTIVSNIQNYQSKNVCNVTIKQEPEYELKLVAKTQQTNESEILIAMQKEIKITYQYFDIYLNQEKIDSVDTLEDAQNIQNSVQEKDNAVKIEIKENITENIDDIQTNTLEIAKNKLFEKLNIIEEEKQIEEKRTVNGIKLAVVPVQGSITSRYGVSSRIRVSTHTGLDISATTGTPIKAVASGTVTCAEYSGSYGKLVKIDHGNGVETWYGHTSKMYVIKGQKVEAGEVIAAVGSTGNSTGPHLHLEIRINGVHVNPQNYLYN